MNETNRTLVYVAIAGVLGLAAGISNIPRTPPPDEADSSSQLFDVDPLAVSSLSITNYDEKLGTLDTFEVAKKQGRWVLPKHHDYPADSESQIRDSIAKSGLHGLESIGKHTNDKREYAECKVVEPSEDLKPGTEGVGTLVVMKDEKGDDLVKLIVGAKVEGTTNQRFVRKPGRDWVYVAKVDMEMLPTQFEKWIEKDLLKITAFDISKFILKDYTIVPTGDGRAAMDRRMEADIRWDNDGNKWALDNLMLFRGAKSSSATLGEQEELNKQRLDDLKFAVDDMKIVDVKPKPLGLGNKLKTDASILKDQDAQRSLLSYGFIPVPAGSGGEVDILGFNGEVYVDMKDGVEYVLRFGKIAGEEQGSTEGKLNRYLFVTTRFSDALLPPPQLEPEPPAPANQPAPEGKEEAKDEDKKADKDGEAKEGDKDDEKQPVLDPQKAARERIKKENQRKLDDYRDKKKKAEIRVRELNARFADWYYVVSEDVYKKIHLGRADIVQEGSKAKEEGFGVDAFREMEKAGPAKAAAPPPSGGPGGFPGFPGGLPPR